MQDIDKPVGGNGISRKLRTIFVDDACYHTTTTRKFERRRPYQAPDAGKVHAYIPGLILDVRVAVGQQVKRGAPLVVLEAMKMKNELGAARDGRVKAVHVQVGQQVVKDALLVELE